MSEIQLNNLTEAQLEETLSEIIARKNTIVERLNKIRKQKATPTEPFILYVARTISIDHSGERIWVGFSQHFVHYMKPSQTKKDLLLFVIAQHGKPCRYIRYQGVMRPSELSMTIADIQHPQLLKEEKQCVKSI